MAKMMGLPNMSQDFCPTHSASRIHPDIRELCDAFYVEERHVEKLNELMKDRKWLVGWLV